MNDIIKPISSKQVAAQSVAPVLPPVQPQQPVNTPPLELPEQPVVKKPKKRTWLKWLLGIVGVLVLIVVAAGIFAYMWYQDALKPVSANMQNISFKVADGASVDQIADSLAQEKLVRSGLATQIYMRLSGKASVKAGSYMLSPDQSVAEITSWLNEGRINTLKVTILPGRTLKDLKTDLTKYGFEESDVEAAFTKAWEHPILADKPANVNLEGYLYPETYFMVAGATAEDLVLRALDEFEKQVEAGGLRTKLAERGFSLHQGITLASVINAEVSGAEDQRKVSQVFQTRLNDGMMLGSDVTYIYAAELLGVAPSTTLDSPYNTRRYTGLPPGAIGNFNLAVLNAVTNPANTTYLFFVAGDDGVTHYSYTFAEHEANIAKYCQRACFSN